MTIVDVTAFLNPDFAAETCTQHPSGGQGINRSIDLNGIFSKFSSEDVRTFHQSLEEAKMAAASDLQKNVFKNYVEFVNISKEISALEGDILSLRSLLKDLTVVNTDFTEHEAILDDVEATGASGSAASSNSHLDSKPELISHGMSAEDDSAGKKGIGALYEYIEGLQKVLPPSNARYIVKDGFNTRFWEVNPTTFRQKQPVQIFLLNDTVLVTSKKKNMMSGKAKMVVEKCLRFSDCAVIDIKDSPVNSSDTSNAFKVMCHPDVFLYRSEEAEDKRQLLLGVRQINDNSAVKRKREKEAQKDIAFIQSETIQETSETSQRAQLNEPHTQSVKTLSSADLVWIKELPHELDVSIANRDFNVAVNLIEKARSLLYGSYSQSILQACIQPLYERISRLASLISNDLANPVCTKTQARTNIELLQRLGLEDQARDVFLYSRSQALHSQIRLIKLNGEVSVYVDSMANTVFSFIRHTCDWYNLAFQNTEVASGFLKWVRQEVERFGSTVRRQVFEANQPFDTIAFCLEHITLHCKQLKDVGLDLHFVLDHLFFSDIVRAIENYATMINGQIVKEVENDNFEILTRKPIQFQDLEINDLEGKKVSKSVFALFDLLLVFGSDMSLLITISLYAKIVSCLKDFFSTYIIKLLDIFEKQTRFDLSATMIWNVVFIVEWMLPTVSGQLSIRFERPIPELDDHRERIKGAIDKLENSFIRKTTNKILKELFSFDIVDYSSGASILDEAGPSESCVKLVSELNLFASHVGTPLNCRKLLSNILESFFIRINKVESWETPKGPRRFGFGGIQQLILDIHFIIRICEAIVSQKSNEIANGICEKALRAYFSQNPDIKAPLKTGEWYDKRVDAAVRRQNQTSLSALSALKTREENAHASG
ncbi:exocyst complex component exo84 [Dinochytrium kinnereticum]|nr:exocyst complex component exo84 [Dinochytrium kinnereticum]